MSRRYIIDGYNLLHSTDRWSGLTREERRRRFLIYLEERSPIGSARNSVTVVLDGYAAPLAKIRFRTLQLIFSADKDADTVIEERVRDLRYPGEAVVVSDDRSLGKKVRALGANILSCANFFKIEKKRTALKVIEKLDLDAAEDVNRELRRLWRLE